MHGSLWREAVQLLVVASIVLTLWFLAELGRPSRSEDPPTAWLLVAWGWVTVVFEVLLLLVLFSVRVPWWIALVAVAAQDAVWIWRLVLVRRAHRRPDDPTKEGTTR